MRSIDKKDRVPEELIKKYEEIDGLVVMEELLLHKGVEIAHSTKVVHKKYLDDMALVVYDLKVNATNRLYVGIQLDKFYHRTGLVCDSGRVKCPKDIYEGDIVRYHTLEIEYQTHYGDNIPMGSYTEPCGVIAKTFAREVRFLNGEFTSCIDKDPEEEESYEQNNLRYHDMYDRKTLDHILYPRPYGREETLPDEEFFEYAQEIANDLRIDIKDIDDFIQKVNGIEVIGNIFENPELLTP